MREVKEETGLVVWKKAKMIILHDLFEADGKNYLAHWYICVRVDPTALPVVSKYSPLSVTCRDVRLEIGALTLRNFFFFFPCRSRKIQDAKNGFGGLWRS